MPDSDTPRQTALDLLTRYYASFDADNHEGMLELRTEDVVHDINQGGRETGREAFRIFLKRMRVCYAEKLEALVLMADADGTRGAAEFVVKGTYLGTDEGLPAAGGQQYALPAGAFFAFRDRKIARVTMFYNLADWLRQVGG